MRAGIIVEVDDPGHVAAAEAWFARWRERLWYCAENTGRGCCVDVWDADAPDAAVAELPEALAAMSEWTPPRPPS